MLNGFIATLVGNLGKDPESQQVNGKMIARVNIGVTPRVKKKGNWQDAPVQWFRVTVWDKFQAEHVLNSLHKGDRCFATGVVTTDEYNGRTNLDMNADIIGIPLDRNDVTIIPRDNGSQRTQQSGYGNAPSADPWANGNPPASDFGSGEDEPAF